MARLPTKPASDTAQICATLLEDYAARGVFRGYSRAEDRRGKAVFRILWHRNRLFEFIVDPAKATLHFPVVLPDVPADSSMYREFREFVESQHSETLPEHRRIDPTKARVRCGNRGGDVSLTLQVVGNDYQYGVRKLIHLVHEIYMAFLMDGPYFEYMVEAFDLDPDHP